MKKQSKLSIHGVEYILRICFQLLFQIGIVFISAGTFDIGIRILLYFILLTGSYMTSLLMIIYRNPEVLNERTKNIEVNTESWDKILLPVYVICTFVVMNIFIGLDIRYGWRHLDFRYFFVGLILYIFSIVIVTKSMIENKYFESSSRIQAERNQSVVSTGIYSIVRHPGYSSIIIWALSIPLITGIICTLIPSVSIIIIIFVRTYLEDRMLKKELKGYRAYSKKVKYRIIPYIW